MTGTDTTRDPGDPGDPYDLDRYLQAQEGVYEQALSELRGGRKQGHWMWFIFPQIKGLGYSPTTQYYSIKSREEARAYLDHPILGSRLRACAQALLEVEAWSASQIFGHPDDLKLRSSMTLFATVADTPDSVFDQVLDRYYDGEEDPRTCQILDALRAKRG
jgi:uncharacterized protein (DUF1810 family)